MWQKIVKIGEGYNQKFPAGNEPFQIITRLAEEVGELATQVGHFEGTGSKREKLGDPNKEKLAEEIYDVIKSAYNVAQYYKIEPEFENKVNQIYQKMKDQGFI